MWTAETVLVCALELLGRSQSAFPPVQFVATIPADVSSKAEAFVRRDDPQIYLITSSPLFQRLQRTSDRCGDLQSTRKLASVLAHEESHIKQHTDEKGAYAAQLTTLVWLGAGDGNPLYSEVKRSMQRALARPARGTQARLATPPDQSAGTFPPGH